MMITSSLPSFEIPTGLHATGLRGMRGFGRGLGAVNVEALAQAMIHGGVNPQFLPVQSFQPDYMPAGQLSTLPQSLYATQSFAQQVAGYLGGSVVQAPPPGNYQGTGIPLAYWVQLPDGSAVLPGNIFQPGTVLAFYDLCTAENYLTNSIPGSEFGSSCGSYASSTPNPLVGSGGTQAPAAQPPASNLQPVGTTTPVPVSTPATTANPAQTVQTPAPASYDCNTIQPAIAWMQAAGQSNIAIWTKIAQAAPAVINCASVRALNPNASQYQQQTPTQQPGDTSGTDQPANNNGAPPASSSNNTMLLVGIAAVVALFALGGKS